MDPQDFDELLFGGPASAGDDAPSPFSERVVVPPLDPKSPQHYLSRELSFLAFNERVLAQARDASLPLLERLRFLTISCTNLDEFFEIRVAGVSQQIHYNLTKRTSDGRTPIETVAAVSEQAHRFVAEQYRVLNEELMPAMERQGLAVRKRGQWTPAQTRWIAEFFEREVLPVLTPLGLDPAHPFPRILNKSLNFILQLEGKDAFGRATDLAVVQAPRLLPRLIEFPAEIATCPHEFTLLSSVIHAHVGQLFPGMRVKECWQFRVTRNGDLFVDEEEVDDLLHALKGELSRRNYGDAVRLEVVAYCPPEIYEFLLEQFGLTKDALYLVNGPVNLNRLSALYDLVRRPDLKYPSFLPGTPKELPPGADLFEALRKGDVLLHHPFQSFTPVVEFVRQASQDPQVLAIKQTLYRTNNNSPLVDALLDAARAGKEVTAVVELRARFDEAANIELATRLQEVGAKVVYGIVGYKTHAKMTLVVRREGAALRRYVHLGTGNYHTGTARAYTDFSLLSASDKLGQDVHNLFTQLTGLGRVSKLQALLQAPFTLHKSWLALIEQEAQEARAGRRSRIILKMNSLTEPRVIQALYRASQAGVPIDLIVRGLCCLKPGIPGLSENISVRSIIGRFLEHHRVSYFHARGQEVVYLSSADWMDRNFFRRVEIAFPVDDPKVKSAVIAQGLQLYVEDNVQSWSLQPDGSYRRDHADPGERGRSAQQTLLARLSERWS
ncbi:MAG: polyphosphate kinase 1 [Acidobacteriota bacterium]